ncbi:hypothetical protein AV530_010586 [Patagioenas fasciata monilis]|uniref:Uncharacterized protein n=1 Tax=Patagioenas fasciata monilis TaxID=372326 RepID=A0A1V4KFF7_PATFA|nr:hypothetical protein AV530_010586 [Patagioenas fasciata monilis]
MKWCVSTRGNCSWKALGDIVDFVEQHCAVSERRGGHYLPSVRPLGFSSIITHWAGASINDRSPHTVESQAPKRTTKAMGSQLKYCKNEE